MRLRLWLRRGVKLAAAGTVALTEPGVEEALKS